MRRFILYIIIVCIPFLSGCGDVNIYSAHSEPEELVVIKTIGIDYEEGAVKVTAAAGTTAEGKKPEMYTSAAATLAEAINGIQNGYLGDEAYFSHAEQVLIGEEAAARGIEEYLDYIGRNVYMRLSTELYIVKGGTAKELMEKTAGSDVTTSDMLESIGKNSQFMASGKVFNCREVMSSLAENGTALVFAVEQGEPLQAGSSEETLSISPVGYALFKDGYMAEYLDSGVTEGAGIIMGHTKSGMLTVEAVSKGPVTLKVMDVKVKYEPVYQGETVKDIILKIEIEMNLEESASYINYINESYREKIEKAAAEEIKQTALLAIDKSQELKVDFCGISEKLEMKDPYKFRESKEIWQKIFADINIDVKIETELKRTYDMENSLNFKGAE